MIRTAAITAALGAVATAAPARADCPARPAAPSLGPTAPATTVRLERAALSVRPHRRPTELVRHLPGALVVQTAGGALADRWLLRGTDAGHGGDVALEVDGVPVNLGSHAIAQGYADHHFVATDAIAAITLVPGPYDVRRGDFATAGAVVIETIDEVPGGVAVRATTGWPLSGPAFKRRPRRLPYQITGLVSPELDCGAAVVAAEVGFGDGPYVNPQRFERGSVLAKYRRPVGGGELAVAATFASARFTDSGVIPAAEVEAFHLSHFGASDPTQGGSSLRASGRVAFTVGAPDADGWSVAAYVVAADLRRFTNTTIYLRDPDAGDQLEQIDRRTVFGLDAGFRRRHRIGPVRGLVGLGVAARADSIAGDLWHTERRRRTDACFGAANPCIQTATRLRDLAFYVDDQLALGRLRVVPGARLDQLSWDLEDLDPETAMTGTRLSGLAGRARVSPKLATQWQATGALSVHVGIAGGFHSSDARVAVDAGAFRSLARVWSAELGVRADPDPRLHAAAAVWWSRTEADQIWDTTRGERADVPETTRGGVDAHVAFQPAPWLAFDASLSVARARRQPDVGSAERVPGTPRLYGTAGAVVRRGRAFLSLRAAGAGPRLLAIEPTIASEGHLVFTALAGLRWRRFELLLMLDNLTDTRWREAQVAIDVRPSRFVDPQRGVSYAPGAPRSLFLTLAFAP